MTLAGAEDGELQVAAGVQAALRRLVHLRGACIDDDHGAFAHHFQGRALDDDGGPLVDPDADESRTVRLKAGNWNWKLETGNRNWKLETGN